MHLIILFSFLNVLFAGEYNQKDLTFEFIYDSDEIFIDQDSVASFIGSLINISSDPIQISILRRVNVDQEDWSSSICIGSLCYSEWVDSVAVSIESGDTASLGVLVWTNGEGEDVIELDLFDISSSNDIITFNLGISSEVNVGIDNDSIIPEKSLMLKAYPNPFNPMINLELDIKIKEYLKLDIYDIRGRHINMLFIGYAPRGISNIIWDAKSKYGETVSGGIYFCVIKTKNSSINQKIIYVK